MKRLLFAFLLLAHFSSFGQNDEYTIHRNGLIYSESTMRQLHHIVDSLNLKFKTCDPWKRYFALSQTRAHYIRMDSGKVSSAHTDIVEGVSYEEFRKRYPKAKVEENLIVLRSLEQHDYGKDKGKFYAHFSSISFEPYGEHRINTDDTSLASTELRGRFVTDFEPGDDKSQASFTAFYFPEPFRAPVLTDEYARMVQYVDCMVDTNQTIFFANASSKSRWDIEENRKQPKVQAPAYDALDVFLDSAVVKKKAKDLDQWWYVISEDSLAEKRFNKIVQTDRFRKLLTAACKEAVDKNTGNQALESLAESYGEPEAALYLKRMRIVVGGCSQDQAPREHALDIARLAAQTVKWEIFLRAHLDIMNDRFQRMSDGSYAWGQRKTYIHELEELDLDIEKLMLGLCLRISNPSGTHYFGSVSRIGRALAEYKDRPALEKKMASMISDAKLDLVNRVLIVFLYENYQYYRDEKKVEKYDQALTAAVETLPEFVRMQIVESNKK